MKAKDVNGVEIKVGDYVIWTDPQTKSMTEFWVDSIHNEEMIKLSNKYSECECPPWECEVLSLENSNPLY